MHSNPEGLGNPGRMSWGELERLSSTVHFWKVVQWVRISSFVRNWPIGKRENEQAPFKTAIGGFYYRNPNT